MSRPGCPSGNLTGLHPTSPEKWGRAPSLVLDPVGLGVREQTGHGGRARRWYERVRSTLARQGAIGTNGSGHSPRQPRKRGRAATTPPRTDPVGRGPPRSSAPMGAEAPGHHHGLSAAAMRPAVCTAQKMQTPHSGLRTLRVPEQDVPGVRWGPGRARLAASPARAAQPPLSPAVGDGTILPAGSCQVTELSKRRRPFSPVLDRKLCF